MARLRLDHLVKTRQINGPKAHFRDQWRRLVGSLVTHSLTSWIESMNKKCVSLDLTLHRLLEKWQGSIHSVKNFFAGLFACLFLFFVRLRTNVSSFSCFCAMQLCIGSWSCILCWSKCPKLMRAGGASAPPANCKHHDYIRVLLSDRGGCKGRLGTTFSAQYYHLHWLFPNYSQLLCYSELQTPKALFFVG